MVDVLLTVTSGLCLQAKNLIRLSSTARPVAIARPGVLCLREYNCGAQTTIAWNDLNKFVVESTLTNKRIR